MASRFPIFSTARTTPTATALPRGCPRRGAGAMVVLRSFGEPATTCRQSRGRRPLDALGDRRRAAGDRARRMMPGKAPRRGGTPRPASARSRPCRPGCGDAADARAVARTAPQPARPQVPAILRGERNLGAATIGADLVGALDGRDAALDAEVLLDHFEAHERGRSSTVMRFRRLPLAVRAFDLAPTRLPFPCVFNGVGRNIRSSSGGRCGTSS